LLSARPFELRLVADELMPRLLAESDLVVGHRFDFSAAAGDA
jgi:hypothetical protein